MVEINPLDILKFRKVDRILPHFSKVKISNNTFFDNDEEVESWINTNCKGRFSISKLPITDEGRIKVFTFVGFEEEKELTYFMLACPFFRR